MIVGSLGGNQTGKSGANETFVCVANKYYLPVYPLGTILTIGITAEDSDT